MKEKGGEKMILRKRTVEHPFGTIKRWMNQGFTLLKGLRKVKREFGFSVIAHNMKRAIRLKGVRSLIQSLLNRENNQSINLYINQSETMSRITLVQK